MWIVNRGLIFILQMCTVFMRIIVTNSALDEINSLREKKQRNYSKMVNFK